MSLWRLLGNGRRLGPAMSVLLVWAASVQGQSFSTSANVDPYQMVADQLVQSASFLLGGQATPRQDQYQRSAALLDLAVQLQSDDPEIWRLIIELAKQTGDSEREYQSLRQYCRLAPEDDAGQLELIIATLNNRQTLEQRVAAVRRRHYNRCGARWPGDRRLIRSAPPPGGPRSGKWEGGKSEHPGWDAR